MRRLLANPVQSAERRGRSILRHRKGSAPTLTQCTVPCLVGRRGSQRKQTPYSRERAPGAGQHCQVRTASDTFVRAHDEAVSQALAHVLIRKTEEPAGTCG
ncbi:hypothetical protein AAFF_G00285020 [Aldrovandia affinis]|uniref:Uncharacterized protein n=1 Tax=Aldrovandia affinis TaxID=143900 RepID=A0AAD7TAB9_9TELE|nr:hypothetical protein AAFF_G00285020 [Aldrovandia affinis]